MKCVTSVTMANGAALPMLGLGTWRMGEDSSRRVAEVASLRTALEIGYRAIDTAEMYGEGGAETVVGEALGAAWRNGIQRSELFVVSKVYPHHASTESMHAACERSLRRLQLDCIDLYLLHWRGSVPLQDTVAAFEALQRRGWIRHWGVSNFDRADLLELAAVPGGGACSVNQVYYSLSQRGVEFELLPLQRLKQMLMMAYSPIDQGALADHPSLRAVAARHACTPAQVALAWVLAQPGVMAIPKAGEAIHLRHNWQARELRLDAADIAQLDHLFPAPRGKTPLAMI